MSLYRSLLNVTVKHGFHLDAVRNELHFRPTEKTLAVMEGTGLLCQQTNDGVCIVYDTTRREALELCASDSPPPLSLDFKVYSRNPEFKNFSEPFSTDSGGIYCFDNRATETGDAQVFAAPGFVSFDDLEKCESRKRRQNELETAKKCRELDDLENQEYDEILQIIDSMQGDDQFLRELNDMLDPQDYLVPPEFIVRIYANDQQDSLLQRWIDSESAEYTIEIKSRERYWKYYLLGKLVAASKSNEDFYIEDIDQQFEFETVGEEMLSNQQLAYTFRSRQKIPLNQRYSFHFQLKQKVQDVDSVVIPRLPYASVKQRGMEEVVNQNSIVSEIYINS